MKASEPPPLMLLHGYSAVMECDGPRCCQSLIYRSYRRIVRRKMHIVARKPRHVMSLLIRFVVGIGERYVRIVGGILAT